MSCIIFILDFSLKVAPGTKIKLTSKVDIVNGFSLLTPRNTVVLEGIVKDLHEKWLFSQVNFFF